MKIDRSFDGEESLKEFRGRVCGFSENSLPVDREFKTAHGLSRKVDAGGKFRTYAENTTVFLLDETEKDKIYQIQKKLYENCPDMLAETYESL